uniref:DNA-directed RNA polymerase III subunit RPC9 n=1 Tax=Schistocephalus solidus TaxID=70667 RepID=A0A0X3P291_SCHSO
MESIVPRVDTQNTRSLTNFEVFEFMKARMESKNKVRAQQTLLYTGLKFFQEKSPCTTQTPQQIANFLEKIKTCKLKKEEVLALINNCPATQVELSVVRFLHFNSLSFSTGNVVSKRTLFILSLCLMLCPNFIHWPLAGLLLCSIRAPRGPPCRNFRSL